MNESHASPSALSATDAAPLEGRSSVPASMPPPPHVAVGARGWTAGRITALAIGTILALISVGLLGAGGTALWADLTRRDAAGYVTTGVHGLSTEGSALATEPVEFDSPGVGWLYSSVLLGNVRIRVTPVDSDAEVFVGIGPSQDVDRYLAGVSHTLISDFWSDRLQPVAGGTPGSAPGTKDLWVASASGAGTQTVTWDPANGSWTVVVMNADGGPGVEVVSDLGATYPALVGIALVSFAFGGLFLVVGGLLIVGAIRRSRGPGARSA